MCTQALLGCVGHPHAHQLVPPEPLVDQGSMQTFIVFSLNEPLTRCVHAIQVQYDPNTTGPRDMLNTLIDAGYAAHLETARYASLLRRLPH